MKKGIGDIARSVGAGVKGAVQGAKQGIQDSKATPRAKGDGIKTTPYNLSILYKPTPRGKAGEDPNVTMRDADTPAAQAKARRVSGANRYKDTPAGRAARARDPRDTSGDVKFMQQRAKKQFAGFRKKMMKSGSGAPLASAEKPVAVMSAENSGMFSVDGKNLDIDPMANKAPQESVNQTDAATRKASISTDNQGRNKYVQLEDESTSGARGWKAIQSGRLSSKYRPYTKDKTPSRGLGKTGYGTQGHKLDIPRDKAKNVGSRLGETRRRDRATIRKPETVEATSKQIQNELEAEPTICSSKAVFNSILEKTYYDDQVLERYKDAEKGKTKAKSKDRHITNDIADTAGQETNKTRGI